MKVSLALPRNTPPALATPPGACAWLLGGAASGETLAWPMRAGPAADWCHNRLLAALPANVRERWALQAESVLLRRGQVLHESGTHLPWVYFPISAVVWLSMHDRTGVSSEVASVGREGVVGLPLIEGDTSRSRAEVQLGGRAVRLRASLLAEEFGQQPAVRQLLLGYAQALVAEIMQKTLCSRHHSLEQQLCRLILARLDRQISLELALTQEAMAGMLGVRRESVALLAARLQHAGLIRYSRGHITVLDRAGLESRVCECYGTVRRAFDRLLEPHARRA